MTSRRSPDIFVPDTALNPERLFMLHHIGFDKQIACAEGSDLFDDEGTHYLDALAQYGALPFGHNPDFLWERMLELRTTREPSFVQPLLNRGAEQLARRLIALVPGMARVTFVNSGAEATELAIKLARARTGRRRIVTVERGFHGKTNAALCATANLDYRAPFLVDSEQFATVAFGDLAALEAQLSRGEVAAFLVETVQGEGGMRVLPTDYLIGARQQCRRHGALFVLDEVQTGLGRTGELFGFMHHHALEPDVVLLAKALGGGLFALGAVLCTEDCWSEALGFLHSSTFANSHLSCSIGIATLDRLQADSGALLAHVRGCGAMLHAGLTRIAQRYPEAIVSVHGQGLMQGVELRAWSGATSYFNAHASYKGYAVAIVAGYLLGRQRLLTAPTFNTSNVLRIQPALTIREEQVTRILQGVEAAAEIIAAEDFAELFSCMVPDTGPARVRTVRRRARARSSVQRSQPQPNPGRKPRFGFLIHPTDEDALFGILPASVRAGGERARSSWLRWLHSWSSKLHAAAPVFHVENIQSPTGASAEGWLIACALTPREMIRLGADGRQRLLADYIDVAKKLDVDMLGLGAFSSVISRGGTTLLDCGLNLTTGNGLTAIASVESALQHAVRRTGSARLRCAVVGAAGSVGRLVAIHLAQRGAGQLCLIGNPGNRHALPALQAIAQEITAECTTASRSVGQLTSVPEYSQPSAARYPDRDRTAVTVTTDVRQGVRDAQLVITATSAGRSFIDADSFASGAIVCDVARPLDVSRRVAELRADLWVFEGGLMTLPAGLHFGEQNVLGYPAGINLACLSETIVLALERVQCHYSIGKSIDYAQALSVFDKARKHGFFPHVAGAPPAPPWHLTARSAET